MATDKDVRAARVEAAVVNRRRRHGAAAAGVTAVLGALLVAGLAGLPGSWGAASRDAGTMSVQCALCWGEV